MNLGKLIRLFLVEGDPDGIVTAEIQNMTIFATSFPRTKLNVFKTRPEAKKAGTYMLIGEDTINPSNHLKPIVYVGEGSPVIDRLNIHNNSKNKKEFWERAIIFTSKDNYLTKTQIQYLEAKLFYEINKIQGAILDNIQEPRTPVLSEVDMAEMEEFYLALSLLLKTFGYNFLEEKSIEIIEDYSKDNEEGIMEGKIFTFKIKGAVAHMKIIENDYVVLKGSTLVKQQRQNIPPGVLDARMTLIKQGRLIDDINPKLYKLTVNYTWKSPSYASAFVAGGNDNGGLLGDIKKKQCQKLKIGRIL